MMLAKILSFESDEEAKHRTPMAWNKQVNGIKSTKTLYQINRKDN